MMRFLAAHKGNEGCETRASLNREVPMSTTASKYGTATKALLACGVVAGPLYVVVGAIEAFTRDGFDPTRHDLSLLANGKWGWIHISLLVASGLLTVLGAAGMSRALGGGMGGTWGGGCRGWFVFVVFWGLSHFGCLLDLDQGLLVFAVNCLDNR